MLGLSSFEEVGVLSIKVGDMGDSLTLSPQYEELVEVVFRSVAKLNIKWPAEKQEGFCCQNHSLHVRACLSFQIFTLRFRDSEKSHCPHAYLAQQSINIHLLWGIKTLAAYLSPQHQGVGLLKSCVGPPPRLCPGPLAGQNSHGIQASSSLRFDQGLVGSVGPFRDDAASGER